MADPAGKDGKDTPTPPEPETADDPFGLADWMKQASETPLSALMANPMAAMAATTAIGFGLAGQWANAMAGMVETATARARASMDEAAERVAEAEREVEPASPPGRSNEAVVTSVAEVKKPREKTVARKPATPKTVEAKPVRKPAAKTGKTDDLKAISGVGPKLEQVLNGMGFTRYADIAALRAADVARIEAELGLDGRIARDGWVEQANRLSKGRG